MAKGWAGVTYHKEPIWYVAGDGWKENVDEEEDESDEKPCGRGELHKVTFWSVAWDCCDGDWTDEGNDAESLWTEPKKKKTSFSQIKFML